LTKSKFIYRMFLKLKEKQNGGTSRC